MSAASGGVQFQPVQTCVAGTAPAVGRGSRSEVATSLAHAYLESPTAYLESPTATRTVMPRSGRLGGASEFRPERCPQLAATPPAVATFRPPCPARAARRAPANRQVSPATRAAAPARARARPRSTQQCRRRSTGAGSESHDGFCGTNSVTRLSLPQRTWRWPSALGGLSDGHPLTRLLDTHPARRGGKPRSPALGRPVGAPPGESSPGWGTALRVGLRRCGDPTLRSPERMCPPKCLPLGHKTAPFKETSRHAPWATPGELNLNWGDCPDRVR